MHFSLHGCIKHMDEFAKYILKTSQHPIMRHRRAWIRAENLRQYDEAIAEQKQANGVFKEQPYNKKSDFRQAALIVPYLNERMKRDHKATWGDKDFLGFVRREEPQLFPEREAR